MKLFRLLTSFVATCCFGLMLSVLPAAPPAGALPPATRSTTQSTTNMATQIVPAGGLVGGRFPTVELFVEQAYRDVLGRSPDTSGLRYWSSQIDSGVSPALLYNQLIASPEFSGTLAPVTRLYYSVFGREPDRAGLRYWAAVRRSGASLEQIADLFIESGEFAALSGASGQDEVVAAVYRRVLGRTPDSAGLAYWRGLIADQQLTIAGFVVAVSESAEHQRRRNPDVLVTTVYLGLLQRLPEPAGANFWASHVRAGASLVQLISPIMLSPEYRARFATEPTVSVDALAGGYSHPWDVAALGNGQLLITERAGAFRLLAADGSKRTVTADLGDLFASGETGLMGLAVDPDFATNRRFYSCQGKASPVSVQVVAWTLDIASARATRVSDPLVAGLPLASGRHGGCQLEIDADGRLIIGTGDAATGSLPQDLTSLGGKVLRVDRFTGLGLDDNPFASSGNAASKKILSFGHRNVQGVAVHPETGEIWTAEHGPSRDDEVNRIVPGGNYGWNPVPGYNEAVPMTDLQEFPEAVPAAWSTGSPTLALAGATFLTGEQWGSWENALAVTSLKNSTLRLLFFSDTGDYRGQRTIINGDFGRLRATAIGADGSLYVTTSNGGGADQVIALQP